MKKKLFLCFRPIAVQIKTESDGTDSFDDRISTPTTPANSTSPKIRLLRKSPVSPVEGTRFSENEIGTRKKKRRSKSFSGFGLFEISSKKKSRDRKTIKIVEDSRTSGSSKSDALFSDTSKSSAPTLSSSSSSDSSVTQNISPEETKDIRTEEPPRSLHHKKQSIEKGPKRTENCFLNSRPNSYEGMFLILINLVITVFYGRLCAVLFTCLFLYSICRLRRSQRLVLPAEKVVATATEKVVVERDYRKKVIMEGLLQRNNYQRRGH